MWEFTPEEYQRLAGIYGERPTQNIRGSLQDLMYAYGTRQNRGAINMSIDDYIRRELSMGDPGQQYDPYTGQPIADPRPPASPTRDYNAPEDLLGPPVPADVTMPDRGPLGLVWPTPTLPPPNTVTQPPPGGLPPTQPGLPPGYQGPPTPPGYQPPPPPNVQPGLPPGYQGPPTPPGYQPPPPPNVQPGLPPGWQGPMPPSAPGEPAGPPRGLPPTLPPQPGLPPGFGPANPLAQFGYTIGPNGEAIPLMLSQGTSAYQSRGGLLGLPQQGTSGLLGGGGG